MRLMDVHDRMLDRYGPQGWWPLPSRSGKFGRDAGGYLPGNREPPDRSDAFEVAVGAILTQSTTWSNADRALRRLIGAGLLSPDRLAASNPGDIASIIRPSRYFNAKTLALLDLSRFFLRKKTVEAEVEPPSRGELLALRGIGPETADSILLYAFGIESFVIDAYTRRILERVGYSSPGEPYDHLKGRIEGEIPRKWIVYSEFHALLVEHAKTVCRKNPRCKECEFEGNPVYTMCRFAQPGRSDSPVEGRGL